MWEVEPMISLTATRTPWRITEVIWQPQANCIVSHTGASQSMEPAAAKLIWSRSVGKRKLCYTTFIGDGDYKSFLQVCDLNTHEHCPTNTWCQCRHTSTSSKQPPTALSLTSIKLKKPFRPMPRRSSVVTWPLVWLKIPTSPCTTSSGISVRRLSTLSSKCCYQYSGSSDSIQRGRAVYL